MSEYAFVEKPFVDQLAALDWTLLVIRQRLIADVLLVVGQPRRGDAAPYGDFTFRIPSDLHAVGTWSSGRLSAPTCAVFPTAHHP